MKTLYNKIARLHQLSDRYIYRRSVTFFNDVAAVARNSLDIDRIVCDFHSGTRRWYRRISDELHCRRSAAVDTVYKLVRNWQYVSPIQLSTFGGHFRECSTRSRSPESRYSPIFSQIEVSARAMCAEGRYDITGI